MWTLPGGVGFRRTSPRALAQLLASCSASNRTLATYLNSHSVPSHSYPCAVPQTACTLERILALL
jgi:hypothetical protein